MEIGVSVWLKKESALLMELPLKITQPSLAKSPIGNKTIMCMREILSIEIMGKGWHTEFFLCYQDG